MVVGSAPAAINRMITRRQHEPMSDVCVLAASTGFASVVQLKERLMDSDLTSIVVRGKKGGVPADGFHHERHSSRDFPRKLGVRNLIARLNWAQKKARHTVQSDGCLAFFQTALTARRLPSRGARRAWESSR